MNTSFSRRSMFAAASATILFAAGCSAPAPSPAESAAPAETAAPGQQLIAGLGFEGRSAKDIITELDAQPVAERPTRLLASIRPHELVLLDAAQREAAVPMPADEFYVAVAPYVGQTHECHFHSLTTCLGELQNQDVHVTVTNDKTGEVLIQDTVRTYDNGFLGLWLPRGIDATLSLARDGKSATQALSTKSDDDATCVTTAKLT